MTVCVFGVRCDLLGLTHVYAMLASYVPSYDSGQPLVFWVGRFPLMAAVLVSTPTLLSFPVN
jgi:hypothetical protein